MSEILKGNAVNQISKGSFIFQAEEAISYIGLIIKGRVVVYSKGVRMTLGSGSFLGVTDIYMSRYVCNYQALDDVTLYAFPAENAETIKNILNLNKDYHGIMVASLCRQVAEIGKVRNLLTGCASGLFSHLVNGYDTYLSFSKTLGIQAIPIPKIITLEPFANVFEVNEKKLEYFIECAKIPVEVQKSYFSYVDYVTLLQVEDMSSLIAQMLMECREISEYTEGSFYHLMNNGETNLYKNQTLLAYEAKKKGIHNEELMGMVDATIDQINQAEKILEENAGVKLNINRNKMEQLYMALLTGEEEHLENHEEEEAKAEEAEQLRQDVISLAKSLSQIINFAEITEEQKAKLTGAVEFFVKAADRLSVEDDMRRAKKEMASVFYPMYYKTFLKARTQEVLPKAVELFLNFGFLDERLLEEAQLYSLCSYMLEESEGPCKVYTMSEWLEKIYTGEKDNSKNEFDEDYITTLRNERKRGVITEEQEQALRTNGQKKLEFEIMNMFAVNNRLTNGQLATFTPVLYKEMFTQFMDKTRVTKQKINAVVTRLLKIDFSIFHREVLFVKPELRIEKEHILKQVFPNIILTPTVGIQASMWQEISNKKKDTPARFIFPIFAEGNLEDMMVKMFGRFRWEICRNEQGAAWNNIQEKSLTSEYVDYIQFYRKNHDLSEEKKEKLKLQIQKGRNNTREIFLIDYEMWIKAEAAGAIRMNKVAREILATYCPFSKGIREKIVTQPIFEEAMARNKREKTKKVHELDLRYRMLLKDGGQITQELQDTMSFYKEL